MDDESAVEKIDFRDDEANTAGKVNRRESCRGKNL